MLKIFTGRESIDKEKAMFERIDPSGRTIILVPDQYTLQMERNAIEYYQSQGLMLLEVLSFSRLTDRVLKETGGAKQKVIDKNGRHMLLSKILLDEQKNLKAFGGIIKSPTFVDMMNNLIAEIKQHNRSPEDVAAAIFKTEDSSLLKRKLEDLHLIFTKYEEAIKDKYIDTESYLDFFISKIGGSSLVKETEFWISGFDSLTPKAVEIIKELSVHGKQANMMVTYEKGSRFFDLTQATINNLKRALGSDGLSIRELEGPKVERPPAVSHLEKYLFEHPFETVDENRKELTFVSAANFYNEAESAAAFILDLVRDENYRYKDIAVICNDMEERGAIIKRVFDEYGISYFMDKKYQVYHNPAVEFVSALLDAAASNWLYEDIFRLVKTGFTPLSEEEGEYLENYCIKYKIRGNAWKKDFKYGLEEYSDQGMDQLNRLRQSLWDFLDPYFQADKEAKSIRKKIQALELFLKEKLGMEDLLESLCLELEADGEFEAALEVQQIWQAILGLLEQLNELLGDDKIDGEGFSKIIKTGFDSMELGLIPTTMDQLLVGTMQRTRTGSVKALLVLGANDGILPGEVTGDDLLSREEKKFLIDKDIMLCRDDDFMIMEENLAIYKQIAGAEKHLWISYSTADLEGKEARPSVIFNKMRKLFPENPLEKDLVNREIPELLITRPRGSLKHFTQALQRHYREGAELDELWQAAGDWYKENQADRIGLVEKGLVFDNVVEKLSKESMNNLFGAEEGKKLSLSPTRLERYSRCPFAHFVRYGLRPDEKRVFQVSNLEVGDVYHQCLMLFAEKLTVEGLALQDPASPWMQVNESEIEEMISFYMGEIADTYKEGVLGFNKETGYRFERMVMVCSRAAKALVEHVREGSIEKIFFEEKFNSKEGSSLPAISISTDEGDFLIEGIIDRIDILPGNYAKIIDYKSGRENFKPKEATEGWRLQLMLYLKAVREGMEKVKAGGVFYFEIADLLVDAEDNREEAIAQAVEKAIRKRFRLDGTVVDEKSVIESIDGDIDKYSQILPVMKKQDGGYRGNSEGRLLSREEFEGLEKAVDGVIKELCNSLGSGHIGIEPKKLGDMSACTYCDYKSICNFDLSFDGCTYHMVKS